MDDFRGSRVMRCQGSLDKSSTAIGRLLPVDVCRRHDRPGRSHRATQKPYSLERAVLVPMHQARIADHISSQNCREPALLRHVVQLRHANVLERVNPSLRLHHWMIRYEPRWTVKSWCTGWINGRKSGLRQRPVSSSRLRQRECVACGRSSCPHPLGRQAPVIQSNARLTSSFAPP